MRVFLIVLLCLIANVLARPEPEVAPGYSYSNGLNHHSEISHTSNMQGFNTQHGFMQGYSGGGQQISFDSGISNQFSSPSGFNLPQHTQVFTIQPSQSYDISPLPQQSHQQPEQHSFLEQSNNGFIGHRTYGNQNQDERHNVENDISHNGGENIIEPRLNNDGPQIQTNSGHSDAPQNTYVPPPPPPPQSGLYTPPPQSNNKFVPPPPPPPPPAAPQNNYIPPPVEHSPIQQNSGYSSYQPSNYISTDGYYPAARQIIHKHVYVHVPPKDFDDEQYPRQHFQIPQAQKHYKIIFIKAPSAPIYQPPVIPAIPQNEEKTLIYVLHKKPEAPEDLVLPTPIPTTPSKPEVYFIKYKTRKENLPGLYGAPASAPSDTVSAAGYGESSSSSSASSSGSLTQTTTGHNIESETNIPTESDHHQSSNHIDDITTSTLHSTGPATSTKSASYGPPHKTY